MLDNVLPTIKDPEDLTAALSLFRENGAMSRDEAKRLLNVYAKYLGHADDPEYIKVCLAVDLLPGRTEENAPDFDALDLGKANLNALFAARALIYKRGELSEQDAINVVEQVRSEGLSMPVKVLLARTALDIMAASRNFAAMREQAAAVAEFLTGCGTEILDRYAELAGEVRLKCWR